MQADFIDNDGADGLHPLDLADGAKGAGNGTGADEANPNRVALLRLAIERPLQHDASQISYSYVRLSDIKNAEQAHHVKQLSTTVIRIANRGRSDGMESARMAFWASYCASSSGITAAE